MRTHPHHLSLLMLLLLSCDPARHARMQEELLRARAMNKENVPFTTDSVMTEVADYFDRHGTPNERMEAHYLLGCTYRDTLAATLLYGQCTDCYYGLGDTDSALLMFDKTYKMLAKHKYTKK